MSRKGRISAYDRHFYQLHTVQFAEACTSENVIQYMITTLQIARNQSASLETNVAATALTSSVTTGSTVTSYLLQ